jgi:tetratricopeptide (TPR) repeat protein
MRSFVLLLLASTWALTATPPSPSGPGDGFDTLASRAQAALAAGRTDEAAAAYRSALELRPEWEEGWWSLGVLQYQSRDCAEADQTFERFLSLKSETGAAWVMRGVCAFDRGEFTKSVDWLYKGAALGVGGTPELWQVALSRLALALVKTSQFELAITPLTALARQAPHAPGLAEVTGLAVLRIALLPAELPEARRELVRRLGRAVSLHFGQHRQEAEQAYEEVVAAYPNEAGVHYAYGVFLVRNNNDKGLAELRRAAQLRPDDELAHVKIAIELLLRGDAAGAREAASRAVALAPGLSTAHSALGRAYVELGDIGAGIREMEQAVSLAPESAEMRFALSRAYAKAGRADDAARERQAFVELAQRSRSAPRSPLAAPVGP